MRKVAAVSLALLALAPAAHAGGPAMTVGAAEDVVRSSDLVTAKANMTLLRLAGFRAVRITSIWTPGAAAPTAAELKILRNVAAAASLSGVRVYVSVFHAGSKTTPLTPEARAQFAAYAASIVKVLPSFRDVIVGNEPNLNRFWLPQFNEDGTDAAAPAYLDLLAATYDALKAVSTAVKVYGGALAPRGVDKPGTGRDTHSPTVFIQDLGAAYKASGRTLPVMDALAFHPYGDTSSQSPDFAHPRSTSIGIADYGKLVALLGAAFDGTAQPGSTLPILYDEYGVESRIPPERAPFYTGAEPATTKPVDEPTQAAYYSRALQLAFCQANVVGVLLFHSQDEPALAAWQSGVYYADGTAKSSLQSVRDALAGTAGGSIAKCEGLALSPQPTVLVFPSGKALTRTPLTIRLRCDLDCLYVARLEKLPKGSTTLSKRGFAKAGETVDVALPGRRVAPGQYRFTIRLVHPVNPGEPAARASGPVRLG
jgi:hypothetical protein